MMLQEYEGKLEYLSPMTALNWFYYINTKDKSKPVLGKEFEEWKEQLSTEKDSFERLVSDHMKSIQLGLFELPVDEEEDLNVDHAFT